MRYVAAFGRFWFEFIVGDDWRIAAGVVAVLAAGAVLVAVGVAGILVAAVVSAALIVLFATIMGGRRST